jgi:ribosomal protein S18 acetylase RimI-like enzyme
MDENSLAMLVDLEVLKIRTVDYEDLSDLEWDGEYTHFRRLYTHAYQQQSKGAAILWAAELPGAGIIGQAFVQLIGSRPELADGMMRAYIYSVRVRPPYRNLGIGSQIMGKAETNLIEQGFSYAILNVNKDNSKARKLYEMLGYAVIADEPGDWSYLDHRGQRRFVHEPAWRMQKKLISLLKP